MSGGLINGPNNYFGPVPFVLSAKDEETARQILSQSPADVQLIREGPTPGYAGGPATAIGRQMGEMFSSWKVYGYGGGSLAIPRGITVMGNLEGAAAKTIIRAFDSAHIPYKTDPNERSVYGPGALSHTTVSVSRDVYVQSGGN